MHQTCNPHHYLSLNIIFLDRKHENVAFSHGKSVMLEINKGLYRMNDPKEKPILPGSIFFASYFTEVHISYWPCLI